MLVRYYAENRFVRNVGCVFPTLRHRRNGRFRCDVRHREDKDERLPDRSPILAASAVIRDAEGRFLLVQRANPPEKGHWTLPGGRVADGETMEQAAIREVHEETGLVIRIIRELGQLNVPDDNGGMYEIHDFLAEPVGGGPIAGDDAADVGWFSATALSGLPLTSDLIGYLTRYGVYP